MSKGRLLQRQIEKWGLFDRKWYLQTNEDASSSGMDPLQHFLQFGLPKGCQPGPQFNPEEYVRANPDLNIPDFNPLVHYLESGYDEGRPRSVAERKLMEMEGSVWPESPLPKTLPEWLGRRPGAAPANVCRLLYVLSVQSGGTPQTNQDLMQSINVHNDVSVECLVLRCVGCNITLHLFNNGVYIPLEQHRLGRPVLPFPHGSQEYDAVVADWLEGYGVSLVHVRHSAFQGLGMIEVAYRQGVPVVYSFHDYYTVCPSIKLLDANQQFCRGRCTYSPGECSSELWPNSMIEPLKHDRVYTWQRQFARVLALCSGFVACTAAVRDVIHDVFPATATKPFALIEHGRDFTSLSSLACRPQPSEPLRVLLPGYLARSKGGGVLQELAGLDSLQNVEWHVLGAVEPEFENSMPSNVKMHGHYLRDEFHMHVTRIQPHIGAVLSIWPETWCHTLTELWAVGLPVVAFSLGAVGDRIKISQAGWLAEEVSPQAMAKTIQAASYTNEWEKVRKNVIHWQHDGQRSCVDMAKDYWKFYKMFF